MLVPWAQLGWNVASHEGRWAQGETQPRPSQGSLTLGVTPRTLWRLPHSSGVTPWHWSECECLISSKGGPRSELYKSIIPACTPLPAATDMGPALACTHLQQHDNMRPLWQGAPVHIPGHTSTLTLHTWPGETWGVTQSWEWPGVTRTWCS